MQLLTSIFEPICKIEILCESLKMSQLVSFSCIDSCNPLTAAQILRRRQLVWLLLERGTILPGEILWMIIDFLRCVTYVFIRLCVSCCHSGPATYIAGLEAELGWHAPRNWHAAFGSYTAITNDSRLANECPQAWYKRRRSLITIAQLVHLICSSTQWA